jgi:hypothetical protein
MYLKQLQVISQEVAVNPASILAIRQDKMSFWDQMIRWEDKPHWLLYICAMGKLLNIADTWKWPVFPTYLPSHEMCGGQNGHVSS